MPLTKVQSDLIEATGTPSGTTFLRGDGSWAGTITSGTAVTASGTAVNFTDIPAGVKRITVMFSGVSTNGTSTWLVQIGATSFSVTGYLAQSSYAGGTNSAGGVSSTAGYPIFSGNAANLFYGHMVLTNITSNTWVSSHSLGLNSSGTIYAVAGGGVSPNLSAALDRLRITTVNGTDAFDSGTINIMYE